MLSCGAFERSNNSYIESMMEPCVSKNQKETSLCRFDWKEYPKKGLRQWKRVSMS